MQNGLNHVHEQHKVSECKKKPTNCALSSVCDCRFKMPHDLWNAWIMSSIWREKTNRPYRRIYADNSLTTHIKTDALSFKIQHINQNGERKKNNNKKTESKRQRNCCCRRSLHTRSGAVNFSVVGFTSTVMKHISMCIGFICAIQDAA